MNKKSNVELNISKEFSKYPGPRFKNEGNYSGEDFRENFLEKKFEEALNSDSILIVNLDGGAGYGTSFLEESFGGLVRKYKDIGLVKSNIKFISKEEPYLIDDIIEYINHALG